ncbi:dTDP-4-dehydrorhamnose 3,5-epimerase [Actinocorallia aurea]
MEELGLAGAYLYTPKIHGDDRGIFLEWFREDVLAPTGHRLALAQANCSVSAKGILRGVHFASVPPGQAKYVTCVSGAVLDVAVDLRVGSPTFGQSRTVRLDGEGRQAVFLAEGLGHAFLSLTDTSTVVYLCSAPYDPVNEHGVHPLDPALGIDWPEAAPLLSPRDAAAPTLAEARERGLLPEYAECERWYAR